MAFDMLAIADKVWSNEFCRAINVVDKVLRGSYNLIAENSSLKKDGLQAER